MCEPSSDERSPEPCTSQRREVLLFAADDSQQWTSRWQKGVRLAGLVFGLVCTATYTANLAAVLTQPNFSVSGPTTLEELASADVCCNDQPLCRLALYNQRIGAGSIWPPAGTARGHASVEWCRAAIHRGEASAMLDVSYFLAAFL